MLTLRQLRYFDALARQRHFGRAAEECAVSPPALSMQIHELEQFLGGELVERRQGDAMLTARGQKIAARATEILSAVRDLVDLAHQSERPLAGTLRLGVIPTLAPYVLPQVFPELHRRCPSLQMQVIERQTKTLLSDLTHGRIDLALLALPVEKADVETMHLFDDRFLLLVPVSDPLPERARVTLHDVEQRNLILLEEDHGLLGSAPAYRGSVPEEGGALLATSLKTVIQMVASGYGVTLLPEVAVDVEIRDDRLKLLRFSEPQPQRHVGLIWRRSSPCKANFHAFGEIVVEALSRRSKSGVATPLRARQA